MRTLLDGKIIVGPTAAGLQVYDPDARVYSVVPLDRTFIKTKRVFLPSMPGDAEVNRGDLSQTLSQLREQRKAITSQVLAKRKAKARKASRPKTLVLDAAQWAVFQGLPDEIKQSMFGTLDAKLKE